MPIKKSAAKRLRQSIKRHTHNLKIKNAYKEPVKKFRNLLSEGKTEEAKKLTSTIYKKLDKTAKAHVIRKNKAARLKSRLTKLLNKALKDPESVMAKTKIKAKGQKKKKENKESKR
ncbi:30S ribosomal protein S20 [bacterium (Candidatus Torokbacteria) CG_4_10_14_0_2_um_filter_35_8]|nr:MAG: 30S ribosomal protein S20 [bacterium (Candidatus Torokbacteria) CG_4_10_14_0_2_um_filter_35_8]